MKTSLNHSYRLVWSDVQQTFVPVPECASGRGKSSGGKASRITRTLLASFALTAGVAYAQAVLPTGGQIVGGNASIATQGKTMTVTQTSDRMAADWQSFSIGKDHSVNFVQPSSTSVALNRVLGSDVSVIQGAINANGQVFLVNPNGVLFTKDAQVNVGAMVASTLNISTADFMAGNYRFEGASSNAIVNQGRLTALGNGEGGGTVALIAAKITNEGNIHAHAGNVLMGGGSKVTLDLGGPVKIQIEQAALDALITQGGAIKADGGLVYLSAKAAGDLVSTVINHTGVTEAQTLATGATGQIYLMGGMAKDRIMVGGMLKAEGGFIETSSAKVKVEDSAQVRAGRWLIDPYDFTVAASGGDISGAAVGNALATGNVTIQTTDTNASCTGLTGCGAGTSSGNGDIFVNDSITWSSNKTLTLSAYRNIEINAPITVSHANGKLALEYGQGFDNGVLSGVAATYTINAPVSLQDGANFSTKLGSDLDAINYTVVNSQAALQSMTLNGNYALGSSQTFIGNWTPIGNEWNNCSTMFCGKFDGLGNTIANLSTVGVISPNWGDGHAGMFGAALNASIKNLNLANVSVNTSDMVLSASWSPYYLGTLVGLAENTHIYNVKVTGSITAPTGKTDYTGGLVGQTFGSLSLIDSSHAAVTVVGGEYVGGLLGYAARGMVSRSSASGNVSGSNDDGYVGGLVGYNDATIQDSYATGAVTGVKDVGGLVGYNYSGVITNAYATGAVSGGTNMGGLLGQNGGNVTNSFWDINTTGQTLAVGAGNDSGMIPVGTGISDSEGGTYDRSAYNLGEFVEGVHTYGTKVNGTWVGFDFTNTWWMADGATRPFLRSEWRQNITNAHELQLVSLKPTLSYTLANDIDLAVSLTKQSEMWKGTVSGSSFQGSWSPIANYTTAFGGTFDGNEKTISNLYIHSTNHNINYGLFDTVRDGTIKNLTLTGGSVAYIGSSTPVVGALAGRVEYASTIESVSSSVGVEGHGYVGGLIGEVKGDTEVGIDVSINNSSSSGRVTARDAYAGGLVGYADRFNITHSHATGDVTGSGGNSSGVGGLVGRADSGSISSSYAAGIVTSTEGGDLIGGLVGTATNVTISNSDATGNVFGSYLTGGLVGQASNSQISGSYATGSVTGGVDADKVGGLVGLADQGTTIARSYATGAVEVGDNSGGWGGDIGGLVGYLDGGSIERSYATGNVTAGSDMKRVGGLVGQFYGDGSDNTATKQITNSYATGNVTVGAAGMNIGGLIGLAESSYVANTYAVGKVSAGAESSYVGALVGDNSDGTVVSSFWNTMTAGTGITRGVGGGDADPVGVVGKTTAELKGISPSASGWDMVVESSIPGGSQYPQLRWATGLSAGTSVWVIGPIDTAVTYTFNSLTGTYTYNGNPYALGNYWSAQSLFGSSYAGWVLGADYTFKHNGSTVTGFTNAGTYSGITVDILKSGFVKADSGNTSGSFTITKAPLSVTANDVKVTYNANAYTGNPGVTYSGFVTPVGGSQETSAVLSGMLAYTYSSANPTHAGTYTITPGGFSASNYNITFNTGILTIDPKTISVAGLVAADKIYDGTTTAVLTGTPTLIGLEDADVGKVNLPGTVTGTFHSADVGNNKPVSVSALSLTGVAKDNYSLSTPAGFTAAISPRPLTIKADDKSKTYGETDPALSWQVTAGSLVTGDTLTGALTRTTGENVGSYTIDASALSNGNYLVTANNGTLSISQRPITVKADALSKTYGDADPTLTWQVTAGSLVAGDTLSGVLTRTAGENVGRYTIDASALSNGNYLVTASNGTLSISQRSITVKADDQSKTYGEADPALSWKVTAGSLVVGDTLSGALTRTAGENVGSYTIDASALANGNYLVTSNNGTLSISQRPITVKADDKSKTYGEADPALSWQVTAGSLVAGDTLSGVLTRTAGENVGRYTIDASALANGNYLVTVINGVLQIERNVHLDAAVAQAQTSVNAVHQVGAHHANQLANPQFAYAAFNTAVHTVVSSVSGGLTLVPVLSTDGNAATEGGQFQSIFADPGGRDPMGFMRVFVVNGGIALPPQLDESSKR